MAYIVSLKQFDGPLDLLLTLIGDAKLDISEISISEVTGQYLETMALTDELDMDQASEFLQMAATLLEIKSRRMLPRPPRPEAEDELSPEEKLVRQLEEYKMFRELTEKLRLQEASARELITKLPEEYPLPPREIIITNVTTDRLIAAFRRALERFDREHAADEKGHAVRRDLYTVGSCMTKLRRLLRAGEVSFLKTAEEAECWEEVVCLFLALLELIRQNRVKAEQTGYGDDIRIVAVGKEERQ